MSFVLFSCLIAQARNSSSTMLHRNDESRHLCLIPDLRWKAWNLSPLNMKLVVRFLYKPFIRLGKFSSILVCWVILSESWYQVQLFFVRCFFCVYWHDHMGFDLYSIHMLFCMHWFLDGKLTLHFWDKSHLFVVYNPFYMLNNSAC